ncbi:MAG: MFS transporter [Candidatus Rokubacteria bacterium]|nr:MFS transporter [Candidatus Rokubacteria bacterium]
MSVSTVVQGLLAPVAGVLVDRVGPRRVIVVGVVLLSAAFVLGATVAAPWQLYLYTGVLGATGLVALGWVPMGVLLSRWFAERRGRAAGVAFSGMGAGVFAVGPLAQWLIGALGWRAASALLGAGAFAVLLPLVLLGLRDAPAEPGPGARGAPPRPAPPPRTSVPADATLRDALGTREFWALWLAYFFTPLAVFPVFTHQVAFAIDLGFAPLFAATIFGLMGLMSSAGRIGFGLAADRFGGPLSATISFGCTAGGALALLALEGSPRAGWLVGYAVLFGLGFGARGPIITAMASDLFAGRRFGLIYGVLNLGNGVGAAVGPWFGGWVHDVTRSYRGAFLASVVFCALGAGAFWFTRRRAP